MRFSLQNYPFLDFAGFSSLSLSLSSILIVIIMVVKGQIPEILCMPQLLSYDIETLQFIGVFPANFFCFFFFLLLVLVYNAGFIDFFHGVPFIFFSLCSTGGVEMMLALVVMVVVFALFHVLLGKLKGYVECTMCFFSESNFLFASYRMKGGVGPWILCLIWFWVFATPQQLHLATPGLFPSVLISQYQVVVILFSLSHSLQILILINLFSYQFRL